MVYDLGLRNAKGENAHEDSNLSSVRNQAQRPGPGDERVKASFVRIWAEDDERSLVRLAPEVVQRKMLELPENLRTMTEIDMRRAWPAQITVAWKQLRLMFWVEYDRAQRDYDRMSTRAIVTGVCSEELFYNLVKRPEFIAYLITPPTHYTVRLEEAVEYGFERLREILDLPLVDEKGKAIPKHADLILKTTLALDMRKNGAIAQKLQIENKTISMSLKGAVRDSQNAVEEMTIEKLNKQILKLEREQAQAAIKGAFVEQAEFVDMSSQKNVIEVESVVSDATAEDLGDHGGEADENSSSA